MPQQDSAFVGNIPEIYDRLLGPMLFEPYAREMAGRFKGFDGELLETAAGTGRVTRALAEVAPHAAITATDLNEPMLAKAAECVRAPNVEWRQADAQALPFEDKRFDAVVCAFGVMFFPDKPKALAEARRVLRPNGRFVFNVWDELARNELSRVVHEAVTKLLSDPAPSFLQRVPFGWNDRTKIKQMLEEAGFRDTAIEAAPLTTPTPSPAAAAEGLCLGTPLRGDIEAHGPQALDAAMRAAQDAIRSRFGEGPIAAPSQALVVTAHV